MNPLISIITINYNQSEVTCDLLKSLRDCSYRNFEVIVIDNASPNDNPKIISERYPEITLLESPENLGFAGGNNLGIEAAKGKYLLFVNNDVEVDPGFLEPLIKKMEEDTSFGVVSPKIRYHHTPEMIQYAGCTPINPYTTRGDFIGHGEIDKGQYNTGVTTNYAHGAAMLVSREAIEKAGMMPDIYFLYYEELDWCNRIKEHGYSIAYVPSSLVFHKESISVGKENPLKTYYMTRNRLVYIRRNIAGGTKYMSFLYFFLVSLPKNTITYLIKRRLKLLKAFYKGIVWNLRNKKIQGAPSLKN